MNPALAPKTLTIPPVPAGWKTVTHYEIGIDVPADWTVMKWQATCGVATPTVYLGPEGQVRHCTSQAQGANAVIGAFAYAGILKPVPTNINGMGATEVVQHSSSTGSPAGPVTSVWVHLISGTPTGTPLGLYIFAGETTDFPGGGPGMAQKIAGTIHNTLANS